MPALTAEAKAFARIKKAVAKLGVERPTKSKSFLRHIGATVGQGSKAEQIDAVVAKREKEGAVRITGDAVEYTATTNSLPATRPVWTSSG